MSVVAVMVLMCIFGLYCMCVATAVVDFNLNRTVADIEIMRQQMCNFLLYLLAAADRLICHHNMQAASHQARGYCPNVQIMHVQDTRNTAN